MCYLRDPEEVRLDPRAPTSLPPSNRLETAVLRWSQRGEHRLVVSAVERWSQLGDPTPKAQLAQVRALIDLCMMDRAWTRLQALPDGDAWQHDKLHLTGRMFLERGWPKRARKVAEDALGRWPDDALFTELLRGADQPPRRAPEDDPDPDAPADDLVHAAEAWLATGAFLRARRLLDHLGKRHPELQRAQDLLWALRGDYELTDSLHQLVQSEPLGPGLPDLPDADEIDPTDVASEEIAAGWDDDGPDAFPSLFQHDQTGAADEDDEEEATQATRMADLERAESARFLDRDEDTQVLRVVGSAPLPVDDWSPPTSPGIADELEGEDDAVVLLTRAHERQPPHRTVRAPQMPDPGPRRRRSGAPQAPPVPPPPAPAAADPAPAPLPRWMLAAAAATGVTGLLLVGLAAWSAGLIG